MVHPMRELLILGRLPQDEFDEVVSFLKSKGLNVFSGSFVRPGALMQARATTRGVQPSQPPTPEELRAMPLPAMLSGHCNMVIAQQFFSSLDVSTALDLPKKLSALFMKFDVIGSDLFNCQTTLLSFMVKKRVRFKDMNPHMVLRTPIAGLAELQGLHNILSPVVWLELFAFLTEKQVEAIRRMGPDRMKQLKAVMETHGLEFAPGQ